MEDEVLTEMFDPDTTPNAKTLIGLYTPILQLEHKYKTNVIFATTQHI